MMSIRLDWDKLRQVQRNLAELSTLNSETEIVFIMIMSDKSVKKSVIKFKDFLNFFWALADNPSYHVSALMVQDKEGRILYRHKTLTNGDEEIPTGGNSNVITQWNTLTKHEKDTYLRLLISQIHGYER